MQVKKSLDDGQSSSRSQFQSTNPILNHPPPPPPLQSHIIKLTPTSISHLYTELEHLNTSFNQLRAAQAKFAECIRSIAAGVATQKQGAPLLVPLTTSLYVPGTLASGDTVVVDVGTGFYVEKVRWLLPWCLMEASRRSSSTKFGKLIMNLSFLSSLEYGRSDQILLGQDKGAWSEPQRSGEHSTAKVKQPAHGRRW